MKTRGSLLWLIPCMGLLLLGLSLVQPGREVAAAPLPAQEPDPFVGNAVCVRCHEDVQEGLVAVPHGSGNGPDMAEQGCQTCHGPGRAHAQDPTDPDGWPRTDGRSASEQRETCLECHGGSPAHDSVHVEAGVSCSGCHSIHQWESGVTGAAGDQRCLQCHTGGAPAGDPGARVAGVDYVAQFHDTPHVLAGVSCVSCHSLETLEDEVRTGAAGARTCLTCHQQTHPKFLSSPHAAIGCTACHGVHQAPVVSPGSAFFRIASITGESALCASCHEDVAAAFQFNERHRLQEGIVECIDCHNPHEPSERLRLGGFKQEECVACHADKGGPFVFEHPAQRVEGCVACHDPHGSPNRHLLQYQRTADLCYSCHAGVPGFHLNFPPDRDCLECHQSIHGSNVDAHFFQ